MSTQHGDKPSVLIVVRHGETDWNVEHRIQGQTDIPLNERGVRQAGEVAETLLKYDISRIVASDLSRAVSTAKPLAERCGLSLQTDERLREINVGAWEGLLVSEVQERFPQEYARWRAGEDLPRGGGETRAQTARRVAEGVRAAMQEVEDGETVAVFSHGVALRVALDLLNEEGFVELSGPAPHFDNTDWLALDFHAKASFEEPVGSPPLRLADPARELAEEEAP